MSLMKIKHYETNFLNEQVVVKNKTAQDQLQYLFKKIKEDNKILKARYNALKAWCYNQDCLNEDEQELVNSTILLTNQVLDNKLYKTLAKDYLENYVKELNEMKNKIIALEDKNKSKVKINNNKVKIIPIYNKNKPIKINKKDIKTYKSENKLYNEIKSKKAYTYKFDEKHYKDLERLEVLTKLANDNFYNEINEELNYVIKQIEIVCNLISLKISNLLDEDNKENDYSKLREIV